MSKFNDDRVKQSLLDPTVQLETTAGNELGACAWYLGLAVLALGIIFYLVA